MCKVEKLNPNNLPYRTLGCPECNGKLLLKSSKYGLFYGCENFPVCRGTHKAHPNGDPQGIPADTETKQWRVKAHQVFNKLFEGKDKLMEKFEAYCFLSAIMELPPEKTHIGQFSIAQCQQLIQELE